MASRYYTAPDHWSRTPADIFGPAAVQSLCTGSTGSFNTYTPRALKSNQGMADVTGLAVKP